MAAHNWSPKAITGPAILEVSYRRSIQLFGLRTCLVVHYVLDKSPLLAEKKKL